MSVLKMSKETGIPSYRIYKWIDGKGKPKAEDTSTLEKWLNGNLDIVPNEKQKFVSNPNDPAYLAGQLAMAERFIARLEADHADARSDKEKLFKALEDAQKTINEVLKPIKEQTQEILTNSKVVRENTMDGIIEMQSEHRVIMDTLDQIAKQPIGTTFGKADILEGAAQELRKGHKKSVHK